MTRPKQNPRTLRGAGNLELEVDLAPQNTAMENEGRSRGLFQVAGGLIGLRRHFIQYGKRLLADFPAYHREFAHVVNKVSCPDSIAQIRFSSGHLNRLIGSPEAEVSLAQDFCALLRRVLREMSQPVQPFGVGNPAFSQLLAAEGAHPFHLYGII